MKSPFDACAVVRVESADAFDHVVEFGARQFRARKHDFIFDKARGGNTSEVEDDFEEQVAVIRLFHRVTDVGGQNVEEGVEVVGDFELGHGGFRCHVSGFKL